MCTCRDQNRAGNIGYKVWGEIRSVSILYTSSSQQQTHKMRRVLRPCSHALVSLCASLPGTLAGHGQAQHDAEADHAWKD